MSQNSEFIERKPDHYYRIEIPNCIDDAGLDPYEFRVYSHIKRIAGDGGHCFRSHKNMALHCKMSERKLEKCLISLCKTNPFLKYPLIVKQTRKQENKNNLTNVYEILDIWSINGQMFRPKKEISGAQPAPGGAHDMHPGGAQPAPKEEPFKKIPYKDSSSKPIIHSNEVVNTEILKAAAAPFQEVFYYTDQNHSLRQITKSDIFAHFLKFPYSSKTINEAIERFLLRKTPCPKPLRVLELIAKDIDAEQVKQEIKTPRKKGLGEGGYEPLTNPTKLNPKLWAHMEKPKK